MHFLVHDLPTVPDVSPLPEGFRCRTVEDDDLAERVAVHREAFAPSRVTESSYRNVMTAWPYRRSLDCVVEAPDGGFAAYCLIWPDDENGVGELEPVGTRPELRRRGLAAAACTFALRRLFEEGGRQAVVYCFPGRGCDLYRSIGFEVRASMVGYSR
jgi:ribosomal protein S18 acetylase RimI-like enzyme